LNNLKRNNMKQQTAVDWLQEIAKQREPDIFDWEKAKLMEKEQIMNAHNQGYADGYRDNGNSPIDYYNETFKQQ